MLRLSLNQRSSAVWKPINPGEVNNIKALNQAKIKLNVLEINMKIKITERQAAIAEGSLRANSL